MHQDRCVDPETLCKFLNGQHTSSGHADVLDFIFFDMWVKACWFFSVPFAITPFLQKKVSMVYQHSPRQMPLVSIFGEGIYSLTSMVNVKYFFLLKRDATSAESML